jgi:hypothetical protein
LRQKRERNDHRREQYEQQTETIDANEIFSANGWNPRMAFDELKSRRSAIKISPQSEHAYCGDGVKHQGDWPTIPPRPRADCERSNERNKNDCRNQANHA